MKLVPFLKPWIDLSIVIQSEVSQKTKLKKKKNKHLSFMCGLQKDGKHELICKAEIQSHRLREQNLWLPRREMEEDDLEDCD